MLLPALTHWAVKSTITARPAAAAANKTCVHERRRCDDAPPSASLACTRAQGDTHLIELGLGGRVSHGSVVPVQGRHVATGQA